MKFHLKITSKRKGNKITKILTKNVSFKDTHREKAPSNKTLALTKGTNMDIWDF